MLAQKKLAANYTNCTNWFWPVLLFLITVGSSCSSQPTDVRTVIPGDALVYLETQDLGKALHAVTDNEAFRAAAKSQPDFSVLNGIKVGVAVTGFETKDVQAADGASELDVQPRFVAVAETNAWNYQAIKFAENKLGEFVNDIYGGGVELERFPRYEGDYFVWTADDGRKAYGLVIGSVILFGNDETAIEKCIAVRKGEAESIAKNSRLQTGEFLASGYVSTDGVAQVANLATIQLAVGAGEEEEVRGFIARVLPEVLRKTVKEVFWTGRKTEQGIEDSYAFTLEPETARVLEESIRPGSGGDVPGAGLIPSEAVSVTRYDLADPQVAWRSVLLTAQQQAGGISGELIGAVGGALFEPYGIDDPEVFLDSVDGKILSLRFDTDDEHVALIATPKDLAKLKKSLAKEFKLNIPGEKTDRGEVWRSEEGELAFAVAGQQILLGHAESVLRCVNGVRKPSTIIDILRSAPNVPAFSEIVDTDPAATLVSVLSERSEQSTELTQFYRVSTSFASKGIQRTENSSFGLIGSIIEQFAKER